MIWYFFSSILVLTLCQTALAAVSSVNYNWGNVEIGGGGFVSGVLFSYAKKDVIYARTDIGGAYRWNQSKLRWENMLTWVGPDNWSMAGVETFAADPVLGDRVYVLGGTYTNGWDGSNGTLFRSDNQGVTWNSGTTLPFKSGGNMGGRGVGERLNIDPNNNKILYLGAPTGVDGLYKSTDAGASFSKVNSFPVTGTLWDIGLLWVVFDKSSGSSGSGSKVIYVGASENGTATIFKSSDSGSSWAAIPNQPTAYNFIPHRAKLTPDGQYLYVSYANTEGPNDGTDGWVYKHDTTNGTWTNISPEDSSSGHGYGGISIDWQKPNTIMVASLNKWWPEGLIWRSTDGGSTWKAIWEWSGSYPNRVQHYDWDASSQQWADGGVENPSLPTMRYDIGHWIESLEIDPYDSGRFMFGGGHGLMGSFNVTNLDSGNNFLMRILVGGLEETSVGELSAPVAGPQLFSGVGDVSGFTHWDITKVPRTYFLNPAFQATDSVIAAHLNSSVVVRAGSNSDGKYIAVSFDYGDTWNATSSQPSGVTGGGRLVISTDGSVILWNPKGDVGVYRSADFGSTWESISSLPVSSYLAADRVKANIFYAYSQSTQAFYVSKDSGKTFTETFTSSHWYSSYRPLKAVPDVAGEVWFCSDVGLWKSTDEGSTYALVNSNIVTACYSFAFGKKSDSGTYAAALYLSGTVDSVKGFFRSDDGGQSWVRINDDSHQYGSTNSAMTADKRVYGRVFVGTNGFGVVVGSVASSVTTTTTASSKTTTTTTTSAATSKTTTTTSAASSKTTTTTSAASSKTTTTTSATTSKTTTTVKTTTTTTTAIKSSTTTTTTTKSSTSPTATSCVSKWDQCGGISWTGNTKCCSGTTCTYLNDYYYQCL